MTIFILLFTFFAALISICPLLATDDTRDIVMLEQ